MFKTNDFKTETYTFYVLSLNQDWEIPNDLAENYISFLNERMKGNNGAPQYIDVNIKWYNNLSLEHKRMIKKIQR